MSRARELIAFIEGDDDAFARKIIAGTFATITRMLAETIPMYIRQKDFKRAKNTLDYIESELKNIESQRPELKNAVADKIKKVEELRAKLEAAQGEATKV